MDQERLLNQTEETIRFMISNKSMHSRVVNYNRPQDYIELFTDSINQGKEAGSSIRAVHAGNIVFEKNETFQKEKIPKKSENINFIRNSLNLEEMTQKLATDYKSEYLVFGDSSKLTIDEHKRMLNADDFIDKSINLIESDSRDLVRDKELKGNSQKNNLLRMMQGKAR